MLRVAAMTRRGTRGDNNQDRVVINGVVLASGNPDLALFNLQPDSLVAVLDGMGGHPAGDVAAAIAADVVASGHRGVEDASGVKSLVSKANSELYATMGRSPSLAGMGTTIAGVVATSDSLVCFNVGDSRVYVHGGGYLVQASTDDRSEGRSPDLLTQSLGGLQHYAAVEVHISCEPLGSGRVLVATDGLFSRTSHDALMRAMQRPPEEAVDSLIAEALGSGSDDDISVVVMEMAKQDSE